MSRILNSYQGNYHDAIALSEKAFAMNRDVQDRAAGILLLDNLANSHFDTGGNEKALDSFPRSCSKNFPVANAIRLDQGELIEAKEAFEKSMELFQPAGIRDQVAVTPNIASINSFVGNFQRVPPRRPLRV